MKHLLSALSLGCAVALSAVEFNPGGVTFDFEKISAARFNKNPQGKNLLKDASVWRPATPWLHLADTIKIEKFRPAMAEKVKFSRAHTPQGEVLITDKPRSIEQYGGELAANLSGSWESDVDFDANEVKNYDFNFEYRYSNPGKYACNTYVLMIYRKADGTTQTRVHRFDAAPGRTLKYVHTFEKPKDVVSIKFMLRLDGCGKIEFQNIGLYAKREKYLTEVELMTSGLLDANFALSQHDPGVVALEWRRLVSVEKFQLSSPQLHVILPPEVTYRDCAFPLKFIQKNHNEYIFSLDAVKTRLHHFEGFDGYLLLPFMVTTTARPGTKLAPAQYFLTDAGKVISERKSFNFIVIPTIIPAPHSKLYLNGFQVMGHYLKFTEPAARQLWAKFIGKSGMRWFAGDADPEMRKLYRQNGIKFITPEIYFLANGFRIGPPEKPAYARFKPIGKTDSWEINHATCPVAIYNKTPYFTDTVMPMLQQALQGYDGVIANWEPFMFHGMGCFCDNCCQEFARYAKLPLAEVQKVWPQALLVNQKYHALGIKFRSWQHGKMIKVLQEAIMQASTGEVGFLPEVAWLQMTDSTKRAGHCNEYDPLDYGQHLKYIDPWGPYIYWEARKPYVYEKAPNLHTYAAAQKVVEFTRRHFPGKQLKIVALPHGLQSDSWVTQPEAIAMEVLGFFVAGYDASQIYLFPKGYDNRYWAAQATANAQIAQYELVISEGQRLNAVSVQPLTPFPAKKLRLNASYLLNQEAALLQVAAFKRGAQTVVAVGNFWNRGEVFYSLKLGGLPANQRYAVVEKQFKRAYVGENGGFSAAELARGVKLHVGALRWSFLEIKPMSQLKNLELVTPKAVDQALQKRYQTLQKTLQKDTQNDALEAQLHRKSELKKIQLEQLLCQPGVDANGGQIVNLKSQANSVRLGLQGMAIQSWIINGQELVTGTANAGLGAPAFWLPPVQVDQTFQVLRQEIVNGKLQIVAERTLTKKAHPALNRLKIRQCYTFNAALDEITIQTELSNTNDSETGLVPITMGYRFHILPQVLGLGGRIQLNSHGQVYQLTRQHKQMVLARQVASPAAVQMKKLFTVPDQPIKLDDNQAVMTTADGKINLAVQFLPAAGFAGVAIWDTPDMKAPTFEPFFEPLVLKSGKSITYEIRLQLKK